MASDKKPDFNGLFDKIKALQKKLKEPSAEVVAKCQALGIKSGDPQELLKDPRLSVQQKANLSAVLEAPAPEEPTRKAPKLRGGHRMI